MNLNKLFLYIFIFSGLSLQSAAARVKESLFDEFKTFEGSSQQTLSSQLIAELSEIAVEKKIKDLEESNELLRNMIFQVYKQYFNTEKNSYICNHCRSPFANIFRFHVHINELDCGLTYKIWAGILK